MKDSRTPLTLPCPEREEKADLTVDVVGEAARVGTITSTLTTRLRLRSTDSCRLAFLPRTRSRTGLRSTLYTTDNLTNTWVPLVVVTDLAPVPPRSPPMLLMLDTLVHMLEA